MTRLRNTLLGIAAAALAATLAVLPAPTASAEDAPDDGLQQVIDPDQAQGTGRVVLDDGHFDYGPTLNTGEWIVQIHDDTAQPSFWRMPADVVARVSDESRLAAPDDPAYAFLRLEPGTEVWVIPQVRRPGVIWTGWNTQEPGVLEALSLGTTQRVLGVEGPGEVSVYLQAGNFGDPQPLWSTFEAFPQESWIEVNTHTHANWVFSEPGVYLVQIEFEGRLVDGRTVSAQDTLRFAVGDATDAEAAFDARFDESRLVEDSAAAAPGAGEPGIEAPRAEEGAGLGLVVGVVVTVVVLALLVAVVLIVLSSRRAKARSRAARARRAAEGAGSPEGGSDAETAGAGGSEA
jgi:surface-anchored protein